MTNKVWLLKRMRTANNNAIDIVPMPCIKSVTTGRRDDYDSDAMICASFLL